MQRDLEGKAKAPPPLFFRPAATDEKDEIEKMLLPLPFSKPASFLLWVAEEERARTGIGRLLPDFVYTLPSLSSRRRRDKEQKIFICSPRHTVDVSTSCLSFFFVPECNASGKLFGNIGAVATSMRRCLSPAAGIWLQSDSSFVYEVPR